MHLTQTLWNIIGECNQTSCMRVNSITEVVSLRKISSTVPSSRNSNGTGHFASRAVPFFTFVCIMKQTTGNLSFMWHIKKRESAHFLLSSDVFLVNLCEQLCVFSVCVCSECRLPPTQSSTKYIGVIIRISFIVQYPKLWTVFIKLDFFFKVYGMWDSHTVWIQPSTQECEDV